MKTSHRYSAYLSLLSCALLLVALAPSTTSGGLPFAAPIGGATIRLGVRYLPKVGHVVLSTGGKNVIAAFTKKPQLTLSKPPVPDFGQWKAILINQSARVLLEQLFKDDEDAFECVIVTPEGELKFSLAAARTVTVHCSGESTVIYRCCDDKSRRLEFDIGEDTDYFLEIEPKEAKAKDRGIEFKGIGDDSRIWEFEGQVIGNAPHGVGILRRSVGLEILSIGSFYSGLMHGNFLTYIVRDERVIDVRVESYYLGIQASKSQKVQAKRFESGIESFLFMGQTQDGNPGGFGTAFFSDEEGIPKWRERFFIGYFGNNARRGTEVGESQFQDVLRYSRSFSEYDSTLKSIGQTENLLPQFPFPKVRVSSEEMRLMLKRLQERMGSDAEITHVSNVTTQGSRRLVDCVVEFDHERKRISTEWRFHFSASGELLREGQLPL